MGKNKEHCTKEKSIKFYDMKIFLSHSKEDKKIVKKINDALISQGYETWFDDKNILIGESITDEIGDGLERSDVVLVFLSKHSVASRWVRSEWNVKFYEQVNKGGVYVLPLLIEKCEIPALLRDKKFADFTKMDSYETSLSELLRTLSIINMNNSSIGEKQPNPSSSIYEHTRELLDELEEEEIVLPLLPAIPIVNTLKKIQRSGKKVRLERFKNIVRIRTIYDHTLSVAHLADCLLPVVQHGLTVENRTELARMIAFHEFNETILGDIPSYTNLHSRNRNMSTNPAEQTLRTVKPEVRERIAHDFIWMFLSEKQRESMTSVLDNLSQTNSSLTIFFKMLDKIDPIVAVWRYLHYYRGQIDDVNEFLKKLRDFFEYPDVRKYITSTQFGDQLSDLIAVLQNRDYAKKYYENSAFFHENASLYRFSPDVINKIIEGCPLFIED